MTDLARHCTYIGGIEVVIPMLSHDELRQTVASLENNLSLYSIADIARHIGNIWLEPASTEIFLQKYGLIAPYKQTLYLLGLALNTPEPSSPQHFSDVDFVNICQQATKAFSYYLELMTKTEGESSKEESNLSASQEVSMAAFLHYHSTSRLDDSSESFIEKTRRTCAPFDAEIKDNLGISASELCSIAEFIAEFLQDRVNFIISVATKRAKGVKLEDNVLRSARATLNDLFVIRFSDIETKYGFNIAQNFWRNFISQRPQKQQLIYPTELYAYERRPLIEVDSGFAALPFFVWIIRAIHDRCVEVLIRSEVRDRYLRNRDKMLEHGAYACLMNLYCDPPRSFVGVYETPDLHFEHDIVIYDQEQKKLIICECKAGTLREPLRDREKGFIRIRDDFRRNTGIQKAYDQANRLRARIVAGEEVSLYDRDGLVLRIDPKEIDATYIICLTEDNYGPIACDLSLLLHKLDVEEYPWAVALSRLDALVHAILYRGWDVGDFYSFLEQRKELHGRVLIDDEMEIMGMFVRNRSLEAILMSDHHPVILDGTWGNIFHEIFRAKKGGQLPDFSPRLRQIDIRDSIECQDK